MQVQVVGLVKPSFFKLGSNAEQQHSKEQREHSEASVVYISHCFINIFNPQLKLIL